MLVKEANLSAKRYLGPRGALTKDPLEWAQTAGNLSALLTGTAYETRVMKESRCMPCRAQ